jgi:hypothetical protein
LPAFNDMLAFAGKRAVEAIVNYAIASAAKKEEPAAQALKLAEMALNEVGHTSRTAIQAVERIAASNIPAVKQLVSPVGLSCGTLQIGEAPNGAVLVDRPTREMIESNEISQIGPEASFEILISELDLKNRSCKFFLRGDEEPEQRLNGEITDPQLLHPRNPYSAAMDRQGWLAVRGKPQLRDGDIERLYISDVVTSTQS